MRLSLQSRVVRAVGVLAVVGALVSLTPVYTLLRLAFFPPETSQDAADQLASIVQHIAWDQEPFDGIATVNVVPRELESMMPPIDEYPMVVNPASETNAVVAEIFVTTHLSRDGRDGLHAEAARAFNQANQVLADGRLAKVSVRKIPSGAGYSYIASGTYLPDAFNPVHHLWAEMARSKGIPMNVVRERTVSRRPKGSKPWSSLRSFSSATRSDSWPGTMAGRRRTDTYSLYPRQLATR